MPFVTAAVSQVTTTTESKHTGPLPAPETLADYDAQFPGLAERIIRMAERPLEMAGKQQDHRIDLEQRVIKSDIRKSVAGLVIGSVLAVVVLAGGFYLILQDKSVEGFATILTALGGPLSAFLYTDKKRRDERASARRP